MFEKKMSVLSIKGRKGGAVSGAKHQGMITHSRSLVAVAVLDVILFLECQNIALGEHREGVSCFIGQ